MTEHTSIAELHPQPPAPSMQQPLAQLDWLVRQFTDPKRDSTSRNIIGSMNYYRKFLQTQHGYDPRLEADPRFFLNIHWDNFTLYNFHFYMTHQGLSPLTVGSVLKIFRRILRYAIAHGYTAVSCLITPAIATGQRATDTYDPYGEEELNYIRIAIQPAITRANKIVQGYQRRDKGQDPRQASTALGWAAINNVIWYFENVLGCVRLSYEELMAGGHHSFYRAICLFHGGLPAFYERIGTHPVAIGHRYKRCNVGEDPRSALTGWEKLDNAIWYFENKLNCQVMSQEQLKAAGHGAFALAVWKHHGGLTRFYKRIGAMAETLSTHYVRRNVGQDPQQKSPGWQKIENAIWYFENRLNCQVQSESKLRESGHFGFLAALWQYFGGSVSFYRMIGAKVDGKIVPYVRKNVGEDPLAPGGWEIFENAVWYFENRLNCQILSQETLVATGHSYFKTAIRKYHGGFATFYKRIGASIVDQRLPYIRKHVGEDPAPRLGATVSAWSKLDNLIWYFEHVLNCVPLGKNDLTAKGHRAFYRALLKYHDFKSLKEFYQAIGVTFVEVPQPYLLKNVGQDPRLSRWKDFDSMIWYFENVMGCVPLPAIEAQTHHSSFYDAADLFHGGLDEVYKSLGVAAGIDYKLMVPLLLKLAWETGLNPETVLSLKRDCFVPSHPLGDSPYLRFHKVRGQGDSMLILRLLDLPVKEGDQDPDTGILPLLPKQSKVIEKTIELIKKLTEPLVEHAGTYKDYLFLCHMARDQGARQDGTPITYPTEYTNQHVGRLSRRMLDAWKEEARKYIDKLKGESPDNNDLQELQHPKHLNLARFRSTLVAKMVRDGVDFFHISAALGHASARTTFGYLRSWQFDEQFRRELTEHLQTIHENKQAFEEHPKPYATEESLETLGVGGVVFKGLMCDCKNAFLIPDKIKAALVRAGKWKEGMPCSYYDMCLDCPNVLVTRRNLPLLMQHYMEIEASVAANSISQAPNAPLYRKKKAILEGIFDEFEEEDIEWAREAALNADILIDPMTYRGVQDE